MRRELRLEDLKGGSRSVRTKLLSVRVPADVLDQIDDVVDRLRAGKGEVVLALLNEGLACYVRRTGRGARSATR